MSYTGLTAPGAAWPETPTAPGMDRPAPDTLPAARGRDRGREGRETRWNMSYSFNLQRITDRDFVKNSAHIRN